MALPGWCRVGGTAGRQGNLERGGKGGLGGKWPLVPGAGTRQAKGARAGNSSGGMKVSVFS